MARALRLAERGRYSTPPNPMVGCVLVRDGKVIGEGWHIRTGDAHAEVRALESAARMDFAPGWHETDLFITPGFEFRVVDILLTNFHLPRSSLLLLVAAFGGMENVHRAYLDAVRQRYRFYSFGDCSLLHRPRL